MGKQVFLRDAQSSSGTFLNNRRLCAANQVSQPFQLHDNDIIQLGVDYQGGTQGKMVTNEAWLFHTYSSYNEYRDLSLCQDEVGIRQESTANR